MTSPSMQTIAQAVREASFRQWYTHYARTLGLNPDPDNPLHFYDYRAAWKAGAKPERSGDGLMHWPSEYKRLGHPNLIVNGMDTRTGTPVDSAFIRENQAEYERVLHMMQAKEPQQ
jgi:hypothetical protein